MIIIFWKTDQFVNHRVCADRLSTNDTSGNREVCIKKNTAHWTVESSSLNSKSNVKSSSLFLAKQSIFPSTVTNMERTQELKHLLLQNCCVVEYTRTMC